MDEEMTEPMPLQVQTKENLTAPKLERQHSLFVNEEFEENVYSGILGEAGYNCLDVTSPMYYNLALEE